MKKLLSLILAVTFTLSVSSSLYAADESSSVTSSLPETGIYVSPDGDDSADGSIENPLATFAAAKEKAKELGGNLTVYFRGGTYYIYDTVAFDENDAKNVVYAAYSDETPVFSGARPITGWKETTVNGVTVWSADYTFDKTLALYDAKESLPTPRYPSEGYFNRISGVANGNIETVTVNAEDILDFKNPEDVLFFSIPVPWHEFIHPLIRFDYTACQFDIAREGRLSSGNCHFDNVFEALDAPGEWYLDASENKIYYVPRSGDVIDGFTLYAGVTLYLLTGTNASDITFSGLTFTETKRVADNVPFEQGGRQFPDALTFTDSDSITFDGCTFCKTGLGALKFSGKCVDCTVNNCCFSEIGANALKVDEVNVGGEWHVAENFTFTNNLVEGYGRYAYLSDGIMIARCHKALLSRNTIHDGEYTAYSIGRTWEHGENRTDNIEITHNHIYDIGRGNVSDMGAIYMLGEQPGTVVAYNWIHDLCACNGIYPDQGNSYVRINHNFLYNIGGPGITMTGSSDGMIVENNIVLFSDCLLNGGVNFYGSWLPTAPIFRNNILLAEDINDEFFGWGLNNKYWPFEQYNNFFFRYSGEYEKNFPLFDGMYYDEDPLFKDPLNGDFTLSEDSPLYDLENFELWDFFDAGRPEK